jgi:hypothetical protein
MSGVKSAFKALSPEQQAIVKDGRITGQRSPDDWLALLGPVAAFDRLADDTRINRTGGFFERRYARKHDVPNGLRNFALPLLPILREDHDPDHVLELQIDLTGPFEGRKETGKSKPYSVGRYHKIVDTFYDDPWLQGHARFADGADVRFEITDHIRSSSKTKRNPRGKIKHKTKVKKKVELAVTMSLPKRNYAAAEHAAVQRTTHKQSVRADEDRTVVKLTRVMAAPGAEALPEIDALLELVAGCYERVDPSRRKKL